MKRRLPPWLLLLVLAGVCIAVLGTVELLRRRGHSNQRLASLLPSNAGVVLSIDFAALRRAGMLEALAGPESLREPEYQQFVTQTGFDYVRDLDLALVAFTPNGTFFLLRGRFDWTMLRDYATAQGGNCKNLFCQAPGSVPERRVSFFPLRREVMALAVSPDGWAATQFRRAGGEPGPQPQAPVWARVSSTALKNASALPPGTRAFLRPLEESGDLLFTLDSRDGSLELRLNADCRSPEQATRVAAQLRETTALLRDLVRREGKTPQPDDLSGLLSSGAFEASGRAMIGRWPIPQPLWRSLTSGGQL